MKYFLLTTSLFAIGWCNLGFAQDNIVTSDGKEIKARVLKINKKDVLYKVFDDPEFTTYTLLEKEINTITLEKGKKYLFNHNLPRAFFALNFDAQQPMGSFKATDFKGKEPGFALLGYGGHVSAGFYLTKRWGLHGFLGAGGNKLNVDAYKDNYSDKTDPNEIVKVNYDDSKDKQYYESWQFAYGMLGPMYSFKPAKWLTIDSRLQIGFMNTTKPSLRVFVYDTISSGGIINKYQIDDEKSAGKMLTAYGGGLTLRISPVRRIAFLISADYIHAGGEINFNERIQVYTTGQTNTSPGEYYGVTRVYNIDQIKVSLGIAYQFKRKNR